MFSRLVSKYWVSGSNRRNNLLSCWVFVCLHNAVGDNLLCYNSISTCGPSPEFLPASVPDASA